MKSLKRIEVDYLLITDTYIMPQVIHFFFFYFGLTPMLSLTNRGNNSHDFFSSHTHQISLYLDQLSFMLNINFELESWKSSKSWMKWRKLIKRNNSFTRTGVKIHDIRLHLRANERENLETFLKKFLTRAAIYYPTRGLREMSFKFCYYASLSSW